MAAAPTITVCYVHPGTISHEFHESLWRAHEEGVTTHIIAAKSGPLLSPARNQLVNAFLLGTDDEFYLSVDTDMVFRPADILSLIKLHLPIVSGLCMALKQSGETSPVAVYVNKEGRQEGYTLDELYTKGKGKQYLEVAGVGMAFTLIKRKVLEDLDKAKPEGKVFWPYDEMELNQQGLGEDMTFCVRASALGHKSFISLDVPIGHMKSVPLWPEARP